MLKRPVEIIKRQTLALKQRFAVFQRDLFVCQYCGREPPAVVLEVDHVVPVANGGSSDMDNLITSCFECNRGKAARSLGGVMVPSVMAERQALIEERRRQIEAYESLLAAQRAALEELIEAVVRLYEDYFEGWTLTADARLSIRKFLTRLPLSVVQEAMVIACCRMECDHAFRYFCGICWKRINRPVE